MQNPFSGGNSIEVELQGESSGLESAVSGAERGLLNLRTAVAGAGVALGGLAAGGLAKSASAAMDFEQAMADVEKVTDAQTAEELSEPIQQMAEDLPLAAEELSALAADAGRFGAEGAEEIEDFTRTAAEMGAATQLSSDEAAQSLAKVATALDEPLENVDRLGDSINELSNNFATDSSEIVDAAQRGGFAVQDLGLQSDEILGLSAAMNEVAPTSRQAATMLEQMGESMTDPDNVAAFADAIGVTEEKFREMREERPQDTLIEVAEAIDESDEASHRLSDSLSTQQVRAFERLSQQTGEFSEAMETSNQAMEEGKSLSREVSVETDTLAGQWELLKSQIANVGRDIGKELLPALRSFVDTISSGIESIEEFVDEVDSIEEALGEIGDWIRENGPGLVRDALAIFEDMLRTAASWISENGPDLLGEALRLVGQGIRAVVLDIYNAITGNDDSIIKSILIDAGEWLVENGPGILKGAIETALDAIWNAFTGLYEGLTGETVPDIFNDIGDYITEEVPGILSSAIDSVIETVKDAFNYLIGTGDGTLIGDIRGIGGDIVDALPGLSEFKEYGEGLVESIAEGIEDSVDGATDAVSTIASAVRDLLPFSPAKEGPLSDLDEVGPGFAETVAGGIEGNAHLVSDATAGMAGQALPEGGGGSGGGTQTVRVVLDEQTDIVEGRIQEGAEMVVQQRERRTHRNTGRSATPR